jgi:hypothetical protein
MNLSEKIIVTGKICGVMNKLFTISLLTGIMLCGCQVSEPEICNVPEPQTFTAEIEDNNDGAATRTSLDEQRNVLWTKGDQVSIFAGSTANAKYLVSDDSDGKTSATLNMESTSSFVAGNEIENNVAYYPYSADVQIAKNGTAYTISGITLPATQTYATASFGNGAFPMAAITASTKDTNLGFKNVLGGLKLQLKGTASIASISVSGNANEILCGSANVTVSSEATPTIELTDKSATTVTLDCGTAGVQLNSETATTFIIALPPVTMASGFTVTIKDIYGKQMPKISANSQTITRSTLLAMPEFAYTASSSTDFTKEPLTITSIGKTSVALARYVGDTETNTDVDIKLQYSMNGGDWKTYTVGGIISLSDADSLQFRPQTSTGNSTFSSSKYYYKFKVGGEGKVIASGNVMSLLDRTLKATSAPERCFYALFYDVDNLVSAADLQLPATELSAYCYDNMFCGCTALVRAPELLPATKMADHCYSQMFDSCTALVGAPELPATEMADYCYWRMFYRCTSLTEAPALPAKRLAEWCYSMMFEGCTSLTEAPALSAKRLAERCCNRMFYGCTSLTAAPPELPAIDLTSGTHCYLSMFQGCTALTSAPKLPATGLSESCYLSMFEGCTSLTTAPELHATTLANYCYKRMFYGCTSLTAAPELPATTLVIECYRNMFNGCTNLNHVEAMFTNSPSYIWEDDGSTIWYTYEWLNGVASEGTFVMNEDATWKESDVRGVNGIPTGWTVVKQ